MVTRDGSNVKRNHPPKEKEDLNKYCSHIFRSG